MRRFLLPLCALLALVIAMPACADAPTPMLWKVSKGDSTVYLLGSMHFLKSGDYPLSADAESAYRNASELVFEVSPEEMKSPLTVATMLKRGMYQDGKTLQAVLSPQTWKELADYCEKNGLPVSSLQAFKPWMVSLTLVALESKKIGLDPESGLDMHFMTQAKTDHKTTQGLETVDQQLALFDNAPMNTQEEMLKQDLDEIADFPKEMSREYDAWRRGDTDAILAQSKKEFAKYPDLYGKLVVQRDVAWIPKIEQMLNGKHVTLIVVGALHLPGPDGVVKLLQAKGYKVERICAGCAKLGHKS